MQFTTRRRRQTPTVIIISLIDVLIVVLIFLMVTTTFKQLPAVKIALPESSQSKPGSSENTVEVTISKQGVFYFKKDPVTFEKLNQSLIDAARANPKIMLTIRADKGATVEQLLKVWDAARGAGISAISVPTQKGGTPAGQ